MADRWRLCDWDTDKEAKSMLLSFIDNCPSEHFAVENGRKLQPDDFKVWRCQDNYTNHVIRIRPKMKPDIGFIIKMAPPSIPRPGVNINVPVERGQNEHQAYLFFNKVAPGCVPTPVFYDEGQRVLCVSELTGRCLSEELLSGQCNVSGARFLAACLATVHSATHILTVGYQGLADLRQQFLTLQPMVDWLRLYHYDKPFDKADPDKHCTKDVLALLDEILDDATILSIKDEAKRSYAEDSECLIHGDLHIDAVIVSGGDWKMVDAEFVRVGPCAYDVGRLLSTLFMVHSANTHPAKSEHGAGSENVRILCIELLEEYTEKMAQNLKQDEEFTKTLLRKILIFAGCDLLSWVIGPGHMDFMDSKPEAQVDCVHVATALLRNLDNITTLKDFENFMK